MRFCFVRLFVSAELDSSVKDLLQIGGPELAGFWHQTFYHFLQSLKGDKIEQAGGVLTVELVFCQVKCSYKRFGIRPNRRRRLDSRNKLQSMETLMIVEVHLCTPFCRHLVDLGVSFHEDNTDRSSYFHLIYHILLYNF